MDLFAEKDLRLEREINNKFQWKIQNVDKKLLGSFLNSFHYPELISTILLNRGINTPSKVMEYVKPSIFNLHSPFYFNDMEKAISRIESAIQNKEGILIFGDRDVDGVTATSILYKFLQRQGANVVYRVPEGMENYGISKEVIGWAAMNDFGLIITVDSGITSIEEVQYAKGLGIDVIITDHHEVREILPEAYALINPKVPGERYPFHYLSGASVAFKLVCGMAEKFFLPEVYNQELVFFDVETTGLNPINDEIIEIGAVKVRNGVKIGEFQSLIKPSKPISGEITQLTGITNELLQKEGNDRDEVLKKFLEFVGRSKLIGHNAIEFDLKFLNNQLKKCLLCQIDNAVEDTLKMSRVMLKKVNDYRLITVARALGIYVEDSKLHRSIADSEVCAEVYRRLMLNKNNRLIEVYDEFLPLAAIGTLADIMPLIEENRNIVKNGLRLIPHSSVGLISLLREININIERITSRDISWNISPILNSPGRMGDASYSVELLISSKIKEAEELVKEILNKDVERKGKVDEGMELVESYLSKNFVESDKFIFVASEKFSRGTIGLLASRYSNSFFMPVIILALDNPLSTGSIRAPSGFDVVRMLEGLSSYFTQYGGHRSAGGFTIRTEKIEEFKNAVLMYMGSVNHDDMKREIIIDAELENLQDLNLNMVRYIENIVEPTGNLNEIPKLLIRNAMILACREIGKNMEHILMTIQRDGKTMSVAGWNWAKKIEYYYNPDVNRLYDFVVTPEINKYQGVEEVRLTLVDMRGKNG